MRVRVKDEEQRQGMHRVKPPKSKAKESKTKSSDLVTTKFRGTSGGTGRTISENRKFIISGTSIIDVMRVCEEPPVS